MEDADRIDTDKSPIDIDLDCTESILDRPEPTSSKAPISLSRFSRQRHNDNESVPDQQASSPSTAQRVNETMTTTQSVFSIDTAESERDDESMITMEYVLSTICRWRIFYDYCPQTTC